MRVINWQDTDIEHVRPDWPIESVHMLQHHAVGQTWTSSIKVINNNESTETYYAQAMDFEASGETGNTRRTVNVAPSSRRRSGPC